MTVAESRAAVLAEAVSWIRTPFHLAARRKGVGVDCAQFLLASYAAAGIALDIHPGPCTHDWFMHHEDPRFINPIRAVCREVATPEPGDLVLFKIGQSWAHAAVVRQWPGAIHAKWNSGVQYVDCSQGQLAALPKLFFSPWPA